MDRNVVVIVLWIVGLIFVLVTIINIIKRAVKAKRCTARTTAVITDIKEKIHRRNNVTSREFTPTIAYTVNGTAYSRAYMKDYVGDAYHVGQSVEIMYNPHKPTEINTLGSSNKADIVMMVIGLVLIFIGIVWMALS